MRKIVRPSPPAIRCACGCGQVTTVWRGQHRKFIAGHHARGELNPRFGVSVTKETIAKMSDARKGRASRAAGWRHTEEAKARMAAAHAAVGYRPRTPGTGSYGACRTCSKPIYIQKSRATTRSYCSRSCHAKEPRDGALNPFYGKQHSAETKARIRQATLRQRAQAVVLPTKPERMVHSQLRALGFQFDAEVHLGKWCVDIYVPSLRLVIFVDGCYWHACPLHFPEKKQRGHDKARVPYLTKLGFVVVVLWEHEVLEDVCSAVKRAVSYSKKVSNASVEKDIRT